eukprot:291898-Lingulodinium_polyedra.AAC.1
MGGWLPHERKRPKTTATSACRPMWPQRHRALFQAQGLNWEDAHPLDQDSDVLHLFPGLAVLSDREREILTLAGIRQFPTAEEVSIEITQSAGRQRLHLEHCSTILPRGRQYLGKRCRLMHSHEALRCQGLYLADEVLCIFKPQLLQSLAGNAFEAG